jgi:membrane-bound serine protease (ClpP class)
MSTVAIVITLVIVGLILAAVEVLIIPGIGLAALLAALSLLGAVVLAYVKLGSGAAAAALGAGVVVGALMFWLLPKTRAAKRMVLDTKHTAKAPDGSLGELEGQEGHVLTPLRPAGSAEICGRQVDVVSDGEFVEAHVRVRVVRIEGVRVVVEPVRMDREPRR